MGTLFGFEENPKSEVRGSLDIGLFTVCSSSHTGRTHWMRSSVVTKVGPITGKYEAWWTTSGVPERLAQEFAVRNEALLLDALLDRYGICKELPM